MEQKAESILHLPIPEEAVRVILDQKREDDVYLVIKLGGVKNQTVTYVAAAKENPDAILRNMKSVTNKPDGSLFAAVQKLGKLFDRYFGGRVRTEDDPVAG